MIVLKGQCSRKETCITDRILSSVASNSIIEIYRKIIETVKNWILSVKQVSTVFTLALEYGLFRFLEIFERKGGRRKTPTLL